MYVIDPFDKIFPPALEQMEDLDLEEGPRDYHEFFWDEAIERGRHIGPKQRLYTQVCRFDENGDHISMAKDCPHFEIEDEEGRRIRPGWTVQQC